MSLLLQVVTPLTPVGGQMAVVCVKNNEIQFQEDLKVDFLVLLSKVVPKTLVKYVKVSLAG